MHESSINADLVFLGMASPTEHPDFINYYTAIQTRAKDLPPQTLPLPNSSALPVQPPPNNEAQKYPRNYI